MPRSDQGLQDQRYHVIPRTLIFLFNKHHQVLLMKGAKDKRLWPGLHNGIGGHVEAGEDILEAAQRELAEETGLSSIYLDLCGQIMIDVTPNRGVSIFVFRGEYLGDDFTSSKEGNLSWVKLSQLDDKALVGDLAYLLPKVADFQLGDPLIIGKYQYSDSGKMNISFR